jgi:hypothetical protein
VSLQKSTGYKLDDYVDVAERISEFAKKYPDGSLQSELRRLDDGWLCKAKAYRTPNDLRPGIGHAFEPAPGKTPYTRDSEAMNAETSAWGRAIVALGFQTKKIASRNEVRNRQASAGEPKATLESQSSSVSTAISGNGEQSSPAEPPKPTKRQTDKLNTLVGQLRKADRLHTEHLYQAVGALRSGGLSTRVDVGNGLLPNADPDGTLHWGPLRDTLSRDEASNLIDRLGKLQAAE